MARLGGPFGFGVPPTAVQIPGGGVFYPPPGDYIIAQGQVTVLQFWDQANLQWRNYSTPIGSDPVELSTDGFSFRLVNMSGVVGGTRITNAGSGATNGIGAGATGVGVSFGAAPANGVAATAYPIVGGQVPSTITIANGGSGFVVPPLILIDPPAPVIQTVAGGTNQLSLGGIQATATCTISAGAINAVTVTNQGAGYTSVPNIYVIPQYLTYPGVGLPVNPLGAPTNVIPPGLVNNPPPLASAFPFFPSINWQVSTGGAQLNFGAGAVLAGSGTLTGLVVTAYGVGYTGTTIPTITITGAGAAAATAEMSMSLQSITITAGGAGYQNVAQIFESSLGVLSTAAPTSVIINNNTIGPRCARGTATAAAGAITSTVIEDAGFGFQTVPVLGVVQTQGLAATTVANLTAVVGGVTDVNLLFPNFNM